MDKKQRILETLQMQPLSEEEKASRHILGRLYGPIATSLESTRNGRKYNAELWGKALADDLFKEKIANKSLFLELGHPTDREETNMEKVCACIPEMPKIVDGDLYAYVDILDTNNGRLLKTLCDYGFVPGISSRGSGDIMANDEVDPETFFLETWDIVQLPAVKKARLSMCESTDPKIIKLRNALTESYNAASDEEKVEMKETLDKLNIDFKVDLKEDTDSLPDDSSLPVLPDDFDEGPILMEDADEEEVDINTDEITPEDNTDTDITSEDSVEAPEEDLTVELSSQEVATVVEETAAEVADMVQDIVEPTEEQEEEIAEKVDEIVVNKVEEVCPDCDVTVIKDDSENPVDETEPENKDIEQAEVEETSVDDKEVNPDEEPTEEENKQSEDVADSEMDEMLENLKEMIRQKDLLENEVKALKNSKTVSDAEVKELKEELNKYKAGFMRVSELAAQSTKFEKEVQSLTEQLTQKDNEINDLQAKIVDTTKLAESVNAQETKVKSLTEKLTAMQKDLTENETKLTEQRTQYKTKLAEAIDVAKDYKAKYESVMNHYIESKASMLGVRPADITRRLNESYTLADVDAAYEELLEAPNHFSNSLFEGFTRGAKVQLKPVENSTSEDDDLSDLLELAGLK